MTGPLLGGGVSSILDGKYKILLFLIKIADVGGECVSKNTKNSRHHFVDEP